MNLAAQSALIPNFYCPICQLEISPPDTPHITLDDCTKALGDVETRFDAFVHRILERKVSERQSAASGVEGVETHGFVSTKDAARDLEGYPSTSTAPIAAGVAAACALQHRSACPESIGSFMGRFS